MCRIQDSPMTTFTGPCSGMEEEDRSDTHSGSGLSSQSGGSGPGSGGQWWPVVSGSRSQPHPAPEPELTWTAWSWTHAPPCDTIITIVWHKDKNEIRIQQYSSRHAQCLLSYQNMCWRTKFEGLRTFPDDLKMSQPTMMLMTNAHQTFPPLLVLSFFVTFTRSLR